MMIDEQNATQGIGQPVQSDSQEAQQQPIAEQQEQADSSQQPQEEKQKQGDEYTQRVQNWRALRERAERAEEAERKNQELLKRLAKYESQNVQQADDTDSSLSDDDLVEAKHLKKLEKRNAQRMQQLEQQLIESRLKSELPDFESVVNKDTLSMLRDADPDLARSIVSNTDIYSQAKAAYRAVKMYGFAREDVYSKQKEKVNENTSKPRPIASVAPQQGESPLSRANAFAEGLTPELAKQLWQEMQDCRKK